MSRHIQIGEMANVIMEGLIEYSELATDVMKDGVKKASQTVKQEIALTAPEHTGRYKKSWTVKKQAESSNSLNLTVHSKNRYQIAHLLEKGHVKRGGGRVRAIPHIAPAEQKGIEQLQEIIQKGLKP